MLDKIVAQQYCSTTALSSIVRAMALSDKDIKFIENKMKPPHNSPEICMEYIEAQTVEHVVLCSLTKAMIMDEILFPLQKQFEARFFCRVDDSNTTKKPASVIEKIRRSQENSDTGKHITLDDFVYRMTDLARFRIVCNFLSDVNLVAELRDKNTEVKSTFNIEKKSSNFIKPLNLTISYFEEYASLVSTKGNPVRKA